MYILPEEGDMASTDLSPGDDALTSQVILRPKKGLCLGLGQSWYIQPPQCW